MSEPGGYTGNILRVDLTAGRITKEPLDINIVRDFIGGMGMNVKLAYDVIKPKRDPFSPENPIILGAGPLVGTMAPGSSRIFCLTKLPANNAVGWGGAGGMNFGIMLKNAGYDHIVITGRADKPVCLKIFDDDVEICDATALWGKGSGQTADELYSKYGRSVGVVTIGQAGENLVKTSMAFVDKTATLGRGGIAAVFGSKNLKAIVAKGTKGVRVSDRRRFKKICDQLFDRIRKYPALRECQEMGFLKNTPVIPREFYLEKLKKRRMCCVSCPIGDKDILQIKEGRFEGLIKYSTSAINTFLPFLYGIRDYYEAVKLLDILDEYGLDMFETFALIQYADSLYKHGIITLKDLDGDLIEFNFDSFEKWFEKIAYRKGFGNLLAEGFAAIISKFGAESEKLAPAIVKNMTAYMGVRGPMFWNLLGTLEFGMVVDVRGPAAAPGGSSPLYNTRGRQIEWIKGHFDRIGIPEEAQARIFSERDGMKLNVGRLEKHSQDYFYVCAALGTCVRAHLGRFYSNNIHAELYSAATGLETTGAQLLKCSERAYNLLRVLNALEGFGRKDDKFPKKWFDEPTHLDYYEKVKITRDIADNLLDDYYDERGWDIKTGIPTKEKLNELKLDGAIDNLSRVQTQKKRR